MGGGGRGGKVAAVLPLRASQVDGEVLKLKLWRATARKDKLT